MFAPEGHHGKIIALCAFTSILSNFLEGYSSAYPNTADDSFQLFLNKSFAARSSKHAGLSEWGYTFFWSLLLNVWFVGFLIGTSLTPYVADIYGRKVAIIFANSVNLLATSLSVLAIMLSVPELLIAGRILGAAGSGISMNGLIIFIQETTPTSLRGTCSFLSEGSFIAANVIGMGMGMDVMLGRHLVALIGFSAVPNFFGILIMMPLKESPKYLLINRNNRKAALDALIFYQGRHVDHNEILEDMLKESTEGRIDLPFLQAVTEVFSQPYLRRAMVIGLLSLQIIVGLWPIIYNSTELLEAHMSPKQAQFSSFLFILANFLASIVGMWAVERAGRRPMLLYCGVANTLCLCMFVACDRLAQHAIPQLRWGQVAALVGYGITYGVAVGPIAAFITTELVPQRFRSLVQSLVYGINTVIIFAFSFVFLPLYRLIGAWSFLPLFIIPSSLALVYLAVGLPETRGREVYEIVEQLIRDSGRKNSGANGDDNGGRLASSLGRLSIMTANTVKGLQRKHQPARQQHPPNSQRLRAGLRKLSSKISAEENQLHQNHLQIIAVPRIVVKSESNSTLPALGAVAQCEDGDEDGLKEPTAALNTEGLFMIAPPSSFPTRPANAAASGGVVALAASLLNNTLVGFTESTAMRSPAIEAPSSRSMDDKAAGNTWCNGGCTIQKPNSVPGSFTTVVKVMDSLDVE